MKFFEQAFSGWGVKSAGVTKDWMPQWAMNGGLFSKSRSGMEVSEQTALRNSAVFACQRAISESLAMLPRDIFKSLGQGNRQDEPDHPSIICLTREANPLQTSYKFFETLQHHALSSGNGYAELQFDKKTGDVVSMWPIPPQRVKPVVVENKSGELDLVYEITVKHGDTITLSKDRMLHVPGIGFDGITGYPLLDFMVNTIGLGLSMEEYTSLFYKQGAGLNGYVSVPENYDEEKVRNLRTQFGISNEGLENAHRFKFLYESAKFQPAGVSPNDAQMSESKVFQIQEIARYYRIPLHKIQENSKSISYNSLEQFNIEFVNDTLMPWITNWEQEINRKFFEAKEKLYVKFNVNALLRGDAKSRSMFYRTMVFTGIMTPNEARALEDLPPMTGGNKRMIPLNMTEDGDKSDRSMDGDERQQD